MLSETVAALLDVVDGLTGVGAQIRFLSELVNDESPEVSVPARQVAVGLAERYLEQRRHVVALKFAVLSGDDGLILRVSFAGTAAHPTGILRQRLDSVAGGRQKQSAPTPITASA